METKLSLLSAGAAKGLVKACMTRLHGLGLNVDAEFGAVGTMKAKLLAGAACDLLILSRTVIDQLCELGVVDATSAISLGFVETGVAIREDDIAPDVSTPDGLRQALAAASAIYFPDPASATAGIHFSSVLVQLGIAARLADRLRPHAHGAAAMEAMAANGDVGAIGCTQVSEILYTPGVTLVGPLPPAFGLRTEYVAALPRPSRAAAKALEVIQILSGSETATVRERVGFS